LRDHLRAATSGEVHERLHSHPGLAAGQSGNIKKAAYTALLCRLHGFHRPFEVAANLPPDRTIWLERDLTDLGVDVAALASSPWLRHFQRRLHLNICWARAMWWKAPRCTADAGSRGSSTACWARA